MYLSKIPGAFIFGLILSVGISVALENRVNDSRIDDELTLKLSDKLGRVILSGKFKVSAKNISTIEASALQKEARFDDQIWTSFNRSFTTKLEKIRNEFRDRENRLEAAINASLTELRELRKELKDKRKESKDDLFKKHGTDYTYTPGIGYHKIYVERKTWDEAREACKRDGTDLAIIDSREEEELVERLIERKGVDMQPGVVWIGIHKPEVEWLTVSGNKPDYLKWGFQYGSQEPCCGPKNNCVTLYRQKGMGSNVCTDYNSFVCELQ